ncbi:polyprenyl synthetase family protein [Streptomyces sp. ET3-23]|uniref:polyprenyl synthetase family protein n=1 Tax=Streptomyces sp. ET3-23 TaxID=2885643 RepID=UPI002235000F|nr:polyprenyl synthetase family protein [Streptomyces sp. ET3-23]
MFHAFCLIHDDVMDNSTTRRGRDAVHRALARHHAQGRSPTAADRLGTGAAILLGDLALAWADELLHSAGLRACQLGAALPLIESMRTEIMYGQHLGLITTGTPAEDLYRALMIVRYKTAKYTCERPLQIGAALVGADAQLLEDLRAFGVPLGEAFQLRDDLLGAFGVPEETGEPILDDLREGKHTARLSLALQRARPAQRGQLRRLFGHGRLSEEQACAVRGIITSTGAQDAVETMIESLHRQALRALDTINPGPDTVGVLRRLADGAIWRQA